MPGLTGDAGRAGQAPGPAVVERGHGPDAPLTGDRAGRGSATDLLRRLEGLPHGHPSSPYHDDGTAKPALTRLKDLELPLPPAGAVQVPAPAAGPEVPVEEGPVEEGPGREGPGRGGPGAMALADDALADEAPADGTSADETSADETPADGMSLYEPAVYAMPATPAEAVVPEVAPNGHALNGAPDGGAPGDLAPDGEAIREPGERLTPDQVRIAVRAHGRCRLAEGRSVFGSYGEGGLTSAMRRIEDQLEHGELIPETEKYALKSLDRFQQKLAKLIAEEPGASPDGLAAQIHDGIRYTFLYEPDVYARGVQDTRSTLTAHGYELQLLRNSWESSEYKGINSRWRDPVSGSHFEIQFHTQGSWDARIQAHDAYDQIASPLAPAAEKERLRIRQQDIYSAVYPPSGCTGIADYRREG